jgi:hypothetical protein
MESNTQTATLSDSATVTPSQKSERDPETDTKEGVGQKEADRTYVYASSVQQVK